MGIYAGRDNIDPAFRFENSYREEYNRLEKLDDQRIDKALTVMEELATSIHELAQSVINGQKQPIVIIVKDSDINPSKIQDIINGVIK